MLSLDDPKWQQLNGGYRIQYDPTPALRKLEFGENDAEVWKELWNGLHHQGDVGEASYAAVPQLVRIQNEQGHFNWNFYALISVIEIERHRKSNPPLPEWLKGSYAKAWHDLLDLALNEVRTSNNELAVRAALATVAVAKGALKYGMIILELDSSDMDEILEEHFAWSELYDHSNSPL